MLLVVPYTSCEGIRSATTPDQLVARRIATKTTTTGDSLDQLEGIIRKERGQARGTWLLAHVHDWS